MKVMIAFAAIYIYTSCVTVMANDLNNYFYGVDYSSGLDFYLGYNDNLLYQSDEYESIQTNYALIEPNIKLSMDEDYKKHSLEYRLKLGIYSKSSTDDYSDHYFSTRNSVRLSLRNEVEFDASYKLLHEARGQNTTAGNALLFESPIEYEMLGSRLGYNYGSIGAKGKIALDIKWDKKTHTNYLDDLTTSAKTGMRYKDYDQYSINASLSSVLQASTKALLSYSYQRKFYSYTRDTSSSQDSFTHFIYAGFNWNIAEKTEGFVKIGVQDMNFLNETRQDFTGFSWATGLTWKPLSHSTLKFDSVHVAKDPDQTGDYLKQTTLSIGWKHYWHPRLFSELSTSYTLDKYTGARDSNGVLRDEKTSKSTIAMTYIINRNFQIGMKLNVVNKLSSWERYEYSQDTWSINGKFGF